MWNIVLLKFSWYRPPVGDETFFPCNLLVITFLVLTNLNVLAVQFISF